MEIWQNLEKNATQIMIFLPHLCGRKITKYDIVMRINKLSRSVEKIRSHKTEKNPKPFGSKLLCNNCKYPKFRKGDHLITLKNS